MVKHVSRLSSRRKKRILKKIREKVWAPEIRRALRPLRKADLILFHNFLESEPKDFFLEQIREVYRQKYKSLLGARRDKS